MKAVPGPYTLIALGETDKTHNDISLMQKRSSFLWFLQQDTDMPV